jgi:hypothetical protein
VQEIARMGWQWVQEHKKATTLSRDTPTHASPQMLLDYRCYLEGQCIRKTTHTVCKEYYAHSMQGMLRTQCIKKTTHTVCRECYAHSVQGMLCTQYARNATHTVCKE